ncbi:DUF6644 family protein [Caulobacter sp. RHG1]|uniref:DUF6644 family protein n=1 Tax=Caulobacter sp. (strain RHG1) TaxID=2545762 RepID=UPI001552227C|nr:DUF6644 family protein [Caulobacter sp. RHG1]NQE61483.1 hypothetical protein [Caulobacter sp. RHG1]
MLTPILSAARALADTPLSLAFQEALWLVPATQCLHILAVGLLVGSALMLNLRILGEAGASQTLLATSQRFTPWIWITAAVALATGLVMVIAEPVRDLVNLVFWSKMAAVLVGLGATLALQRLIRRHGEKLDRAGAPRMLLRAAAVAVTGLWAGVVVLGRLIAYAQLKLG